MKYTQIPADTFQKLQLNAGVIAKSFTPGTGTISSLVGATTGGCTFTATPEYVDYGDDIDNCPKNMMELKKLKSWEAKLAGTFVSIDAAGVKSLLGAADADSSDATKIVPRKDITDDDFDDIWWVGDYSDKNNDGSGGAKAGFIAVHLMNALNTAGLSISATDDAKGQFAFEYTAHFSMDDQGTVPFEIYVVAGN